MRTSRWVEDRSILFPAITIGMSCTGRTGKLRERRNRKQMAFLNVRPPNKYLEALSGLEMLNAGNKC